MERAGDEFDLDYASALVDEMVVSCRDDTVGDRIHWVGVLCAYERGATSGNTVALDRSIPHCRFA